MASRSENRAQRRARILESAWQCFAARGFHATGMAELAAEAGLSPANLYRYFRSKDEIVAAVVQQAREDFAQHVAQLLESADALTSLLAIFRYWATTPGADSSRLWLEVLAEAGRGGQVRAVFLPFDQLTLEPMITLIERGQASGELATDLDPRVTAQWLTAILDGLTARIALEPGLDLCAWLRESERLIRRALRATAP